MSEFSLGKQERLKSRKAIEELMAHGNSIHEFPIRCVWLYSEEPLESPAQLVVSVPKRSFKRAVDRNRIKRQMREAYRLNKSILYEHCNSTKKHCFLMLIYTGKEALNYNLIKEKIILTLQRLVKTD